LYPHHRELNSFPTRRSSDLPVDKAPAAPPWVLTPAFPPPLTPAWPLTPPCATAPAFPPLAPSPDGGVGAPHAGMSSQSASPQFPDRKSTRLNSSHVKISYAV